MIKKYDQKLKLKIDIKSPKINSDKMFIDLEQARQTYLFMAKSYIKHLKSGEHEKAECLEKLIRNYIILASERGLKDLKEVFELS